MDLSPAIIVRPSGLSVAMYAVSTADTVFGLPRPLGDRPGSPADTRLRQDAEEVR